MRQLTDEDLDAIAQRVAEIVAGRQPTAGALIDAAEVARRYGVRRTWVYDHADQLGAIPLSDRPKARLRFDPAKVAAAMATRNGRDQRPPDRPSRPRRPTTPSGDAGLLAIDVSRGPLGALARRRACAAVG